MATNLVSIPVKFEVRYSAVHELLDHIDTKGATKVDISNSDSVAILKDKVTLQLTPMDKAILILQAEKNKLALRSLVDAARNKIWEAALTRYKVDKKKKDEWMNANRQPGQSESSWKLKIKYLETFYPSWTSELELENDMLATVNNKEYNKVLCGPAHSFTASDQEVAVRNVEDGLEGFYNAVYDYVHE
jgi:hypothetical protein